MFVSKLTVVLAVARLLTASCSSSLFSAADEQSTRPFGTKIDESAGVDGVRHVADKSFPKVRPQQRQLQQITGNVEEEVPIMADGHYGGRYYPYKTGSCTCSKDAHLEVRRVASAELKNIPLLPEVYPVLQAYIDQLVDLSVCVLHSVDCGCDHRDYFYVNKYRVSTYQCCCDVNAIRNIFIKYMKEIAGSWGMTHQGGLEMHPVVDTQSVCKKWEFGLYQDMVQRAAKAIFAVGSIYFSDSSPICEDVLANPPVADPCETVITSCGGGRLTGRLRLVGDLECTDGTGNDDDLDDEPCRSSGLCLGPGAILDCREFEIRNSGLSSHNGVSMLQDTTITGCSITGFTTYGIEVKEDAQNVLIKDTTLSGNEEGVSVGSSSSAVALTNVVANGNLILGIAIESGATATLTSITVQNSGNDAIFISFNTTATLTSVTVENNDEEGIVIDKGATVTLTSVKVTNNGEEGIEIRNTADVTFGEQVESCNNTGSDIIFLGTGATVSGENPTCDQCIDDNTGGNCMQVTCEPCS